MVESENVLHMKVRLQQQEIQKAAHNHIRQQKHILIEKHSLRNKNRCWQAEKPTRFSRI